MPRWPQMSRSGYKALPQTHKTPIVELKILNILKYIKICWIHCMLCTLPVYHQSEVLLHIQPIRGQYYCDDKSENWYQLLMNQTHGSSIAHAFVQMSVCRSKIQIFYSEFHFCCVVKSLWSTFQRNLHTNLWRMESLKVGKKYLNWHQFPHDPPPSIVILKQDQKSEV